MKNKNRKDPWGIVIFIVVLLIAFLALSCDSPMAQVKEKPVYTYVVTHQYGVDTVIAEMVTMSGVTGKNGTRAQVAFKIGDVNVAYYIYHNGERPVTYRTINQTR